VGAGCVLPPAPVLDCWPPVPSRLLCHGGSWPCWPVACWGHGGEGRTRDQRGLGRARDQRGGQINVAGAGSETGGEGQRAAGGGSARRGRGLGR